MDKLKLQMTLLTGLFVGLFMLTSPTQRVLADTGHEGATRLEDGSFAETYFILASSDSGTALWNDSFKRPSGLCKVYSGSGIFIGTTSAVSDAGVLHENIRIGFPMGASDTFKTASFTGTLYATAEPGASNVDVRCINSLVR